MSEQTTQKQPDLELGFRQLVDALFRKFWLVIGMSVLCAALAMGLTYLLITPQYQSSVLFYSSNSAMPMTEGRLSSDDLKAGEDLVDLYAIVLESRVFLTEVKEYAGSDRSVSELKKMISAKTVDSTKIFQVNVADPDPQEAVNIARAVEVLFPVKIASVIEGASTKVIDPPVEASSPSSPNYMYSALLGCLVGFSICVGFAIFQPERFAKPVHLMKRIRKKAVPVS